MNIKDVTLKQIRRQSLAEARHLAGEFARAAAADREQILAELEYAQWLAETAGDALPAAMLD